MAGVDGIAPPLRDSEPPVPLLYETPKNSSTILSPQAGTLFLLAEHSTAPPLGLNSISDSHSDGESQRDIGIPICV